MPKLILTPQPDAWNDVALRQSCRIRRVDPTGTRDEVLWWESAPSLAPLEQGDAEPYLIATLLTAMAEARDVRIEGHVGKRLLANLEEFMLAWSRWKPDLYHKVRLVADEIRDIPHAVWSDRATAAFSGGVDASYTVWRHHSGEAGHGSRSIAACVLVQGFDMTLQENEKFAASLALAKESLDDLGIETVALRTNLRELFDLDWHDLHGPALVAALHFLKSKAPTALVGSSDPYDQLVLPYGSNPVTDPLLSSDSLEVVHDGCGTDRTGKVATIAQWKVGSRNLRVCWKGKQVAANCGRCEKCLRTRLNFLVNGLEPPENLAPRDAPFDFEVLDSESDSILQEFTQILEGARKAGRDEPWVRQLERRLEWLAKRNTTRRIVRRTKRIVKEFAARLG